MFYPCSQTQVVRKRRRLNSATSDKKEQKDPGWGWPRYCGSNISSSSRAATTCQPMREVGGYEGLIGNTPMVKLQSLSAATSCDILVKVGLLYSRFVVSSRISGVMFLAPESCDESCSTDPKHPPPTSRVAMFLRQFYDTHTIRLCRINISIIQRTCCSA